MAFRQVPIDVVVRDHLTELLGTIEHELDGDAVAIYGPIVYGLDEGLREAIEHLDAHQKKLIVVLDTPRGIVEVVERMVETVRHFYQEVEFIVPDRAMSAGTIFAMSGDAIWMDYFSRLGPIDPQVEKDGRLVPALSYLVQYRRLIKKDREGKLTSAEFALLDKFDLAELHQFEQARNLSVSLLKKWLATYKFKNWHKTETHKHVVTPRLRQQRAVEIAEILSNSERWFSHGRGISRSTLESDEIKLRIDDLAAKKELHEAVRTYYTCLRDFCLQMKQLGLVQTRKYF